MTHIIIKLIPIVIQLIIFVYLYLTNKELNEQEKEIKRISRELRILSEDDWR